MNNHRDVEAEATRRAPVNEKFAARDANAHYRIGFREGAEWAARDAIIIPRADLPEVCIGHEAVDFVYGEKGHTEPIPEGMSADELIALGLELKATPPVDEAQVDALAQHLYAATNDPNDIDVPDVARRLVTAGVRAPQAGDPK